MNFSESDRKHIADQYAGQECYLDGQKAKISGRLDQFATVATLDGSRQVVFAWPAVARIMETAGAEFRS